jgi:hypothetical protein
VDGSSNPAVPSPGLQQTTGKKQARSEKKAVTDGGKAQEEKNAGEGTRVSLLLGCPALLPRPYHSPVLLCSKQSLSVSETGRICMLRLTSPP